MKHPLNLRINLLLLLLCYLARLAGQNGDYFLDNQRYSFIKYDDNKIQIPANDSLFSALFSRFDTLLSTGNGKINIVHMGGSHIQADIYTQLLRQRFSDLSPDMAGGRGFVFPFKVAKTNNPSNYGVSYTGSWTSCKSTRLDDNCTLGLSGIVVSTSDSLASITFDLSKSIHPSFSFNSVRAFHEPSSYKLLILQGKDTISGSYDTLQGCSHFELKNDEKLLHLLFIRQIDSTSINFMGVSLDSDEPGIVYSAVGVNGAKLASYLRSELYSSQLAALQPDLILFSIGTNDGYTRRFEKEKFYLEYCELIEKTKIAAPEAAIIITVPNDSYLYKRYVNQNTAIMRQEIYKLAENYDCGIWDFYTIMGGLNSAQPWYSLKLMQYDRIHFTRDGYLLKGDLLFSAFLKAWEETWIQNLNK